MKLNHLQQECYNRAAMLCSKSEKSSGSVGKKLQEWGLSPEDAEPVLKKLTDNQFIDDRRFARSYARDKFRLNKWGKIKISYQLRAEKIPGPLIDQAIQEIEDGAYLETLTKLLFDKNKTLKAANPYERRGKLLRFAQGHGFEPELIHPVIDQIEEESTKSRER